MSGAPRIGVLTTSRADFGIYASVLDAFAACGLDYGLYLAGMHTSEAHGRTEAEIQASGRPIAARLETLTGGDAPLDAAMSIGLGVQKFAQVFCDHRPELVVALGDRFEMHAAVLAAVPFRLPVAHIHGGEETEGAIDNVLRHSITKLSHLHFCSTELAGRRIRAMGEAPERVHVVGAPALDALKRFEPLSASEMGERFGVELRTGYVLAVLHPETLKAHNAHQDANALIDALDRFGAPVVVTGSNADPSGEALTEAMRAAAHARPGWTFVHSFGAAGFHTAMAHARLMAGNSSAGIIEAASFALPVVNIGDRQAGRERSENTIDAPAEPGAILAALRKADAPAFRHAARQGGNVYGDGRAGDRIADVIKGALKTGIDARKRFHLAS